MPGDPGALKPTTRFADRVDAYVRYRPSYPPEVLDALRDDLGLRPEHVVADVGSGTGILSALLVGNGNMVHGVEPSPEMAAAAVAALGASGRFHDVRGTAEATTLAPGSVDLVTAGQAFHWFKVEAAREELRRVLRPPRRAAVLWNLRRLDATPFLREYEAFLHEWGTDYKEVAVRYAEPEALSRFFAGGRMETRRFSYLQVFDAEGVRGRLLSSSYAPPPGHPRHEGMLAALDVLVARHAREGRVAFEYDTEMYLGTLG
jgi:SAM-dependent methyltransferase